jgi:hypothetical protein
MKSWISSRTIWANVIAGAVTLATVFGVDLGLTAETQAELVSGIMVLVNIALRFATSTAIK